MHTPSRHRRRFLRNSGLALAALGSPHASHVAAQMSTSTPAPTSTPTTATTMNPSNNPLGIRRADHVGWTVADLDAVMNFYQRVFGAQLLYRLGPIDAADIPREADGRDWTEAHVRVAGAQLELALLQLPCDLRLELFRYTKPDSATARPLRSNHIGSNHLGMEVDDMDAAAQRLRENGCTVMERIAFDEGPTAGVQFQYAFDPWGNILELVFYADQNKRPGQQPAQPKP